MISEGRMSGTIDQLKGIIYFKSMSLSSLFYTSVYLSLSLLPPSPSFSLFPMPRYLSEQEMLPSWDGHIHTVCHLVNDIVDKISGQYPEWTAKSMDAQMSY